MLAKDWHRDQRNRFWSLEIDLYIYDQLIFKNGAEIFKGEGILFAVNGSGTGR